MESASNNKQSTNKIMAKISKEFKIGIAFIIAMFLLYYGISFLKGVNIFKPSDSFIVVFDDITGMTISSPVTLNGFQIGLVSSMELDPKNQGRVITYLNMNKGVKIPKNSKLYLDVSMLGTATLILEPNTYVDEYISYNDTIHGIRKKGLMDAAGDLGPQVGVLIPKIDSILTGIQLLVSNPALAQSLENVNQITSDLTKSTKQMNAIMTKLNQDMPTITGNLASMSNDLSGFSKKVNSLDLESTYQSIDSTMKNIHLLSSKMATKDNSLGLLLNDRQMYDSINTTINNASLLLKDVKENPQRYINVKVF